MLVDFRFPVVFVVASDFDRGLKASKKIPPAFLDGDWVGVLDWAFFEWPFCETTVLSSSELRRSLLLLLSPTGVVALLLDFELGCETLLWPEPDLGWPRPRDWSQVPENFKISYHHFMEVLSNYVANRERERNIYD